MIKITMIGDERDAREALEKRGITPRSHFFFEPNINYCSVLISDEEETESWWKESVGTNSGDLEDVRPNWTVKEFYEVMKMRY